MPPDIADIIRACWHPNPLHRPSMEEVWGMLLEVQRKVGVGVWGASTLLAVVCVCVGGGGRWGGVGCGGLRTGGAEHGCDVQSGQDKSV
jgi:hypothetical protein